MLNDFINYCRDIGILDYEQEFEQEKKQQELDETLFMHLLKLNRNSLLELSQRIANIFYSKYQKPSNNASTIKMFSQANLYDKSLQREEIKILKEQFRLDQEINQCTFKPQISKKSQDMDPDLPVHMRLTKYGSEKKIKQKINQEIKQRGELTSCTFRPQINQSTSQGNPFERLYKDALSHRQKPQPPEIVYSHKPQLISAPLVPQDYISIPVGERLYNNFLDQQQHLIAKQEEKQSEELKDCTFTPQVNNRACSGSRVFDRLYHNSNQQSEQKEQPNKIMTNKKSEQIIKNASQDSGYVSQFQLEQSPFDRLYGEHKRIERRKKLKQESQI
ncbi:hypothetical protein pb186bvf_001173 [Paramecium bursaria]